MRKVYVIAFLALLHLCSIGPLAYGQFATSPPPGFLPNNPLPIPDTIHGPVYDLHMVDAVHSFWPGQTPVHTMAYQHPGNLTNSYLGPTLMWYRGTNITANITNHTTDTSTNHWHGAHIPAYTDGGPHQPIPPSPDPNSVWSPSFAILDSSATQWYHPHLHHHTFMQVQMGMAGMVFVRDPQDPYNGQLPNDYGVDEFPIIIQDRNFYTPVGENYQIDTNCSVGNIFLVNGTLRPTVTLPAQIVKFRVLSAGSERSFNVGLVDGASIPSTPTKSELMRATWQPRCPPKRPCWG
jgi:FtsP/CotA-like multicopper oxidase with cupredoxin domain